MNWQELAATSPYQTAVAVEQALQCGDVPEATAGIQELIDALSRSERRALRSQLARLMLHVIKWQAQPERRSRSWQRTINQARWEIEDIQEETPSLNRAVIERVWANCLRSALEDAEVEMGQKPTVTALSWEEVFDREYDVDLG